MAGSRWARPRKPLTNLSTPSIEPKAEKSEVSSWRRILNRRPKSDDLIVNQPEPSRNVSLLSGRVLDQSDEEIPDIRLPPIPTVSLLSDRVLYQSDEEIP